MRHLGSFLLALILAPIVYLLTGLGLSAFGQAVERGVDQRPLATVLALATLVVGGGVYAVLVMARLSPIGPALAGFFFLGMPAWPLVDPVSYHRVLDDIGARFNLLGVEILGIDVVGSSGLGVLLAVPLLATLASPRRWSRYDTRPAAQVAYPGYPAQPPAAYAGPTRYATQPEPVTEQLPDVAPPTLHYPRYSAPVAVPTPPAAATVVLPPASGPPVPPSPPAPQPTPPAPVTVVLPPASGPAVPPATQPSPPTAPASAAPTPGAAAPTPPAAPASTPGAAAPTPPAAPSASASPMPAEAAPPAPETTPVPPVPTRDRAADQEISIPRLEQDEPTEPAPKPDTPKAELPKPELPKAEPPRSEPPKPGTPSAEAAKPGEEPTVKIDPDTLKPI
ncbi:hypothetical protein AB0H43_07685 [Hamadaea sp. NPDC050747]|uniref:hypothetical protein n=1 Tax=Hamadaea sp. NPDC050747 TaxID=3155789 RepID=UPI0033D408E0